MTLDDFSIADIVPIATVVASAVVAALANVANAKCSQLSLLIARPQRAGLPSSLS
jgi:hypothetical protein